MINSLHYSFTLPSAFEPKFAIYIPLFISVNNTANIDSLTYKWQKSAIYTVLYEPNYFEFIIIYYNIVNSVFVVVNEYIIILLSNLLYDTGSVFKTKKFLPNTNLILIAYVIPANGTTPYKNYLQLVPVHSFTNAFTPPVVLNTVLITCLLSLVTVNNSHLSPSPNSLLKSILFKNVPFLC